MVGFNGVKNPELIFSIYPDPSDKNNTSDFTTQIVNKQGYYPPDIQFLIDKIEQSDDPISTEQAVDQFFEFITNRKNELINLHKKSIKWEKINQRSIYILENQFNEALSNANQSDLIYLGGPLAGGRFKLDHELKEMTLENKLDILEFGNDNAGQPIAKIAIDPEISDFVLESSEDRPLNIEEFPLQIGNYVYRLVRISEFFAKSYQRKSMYIDFSPIIDSAIVAARALLSTIVPYFGSLPEILKQKYDQYKLNNGEGFPNFLKIQKLNNQTNSRIELEGYSFKSNNREYSIKHGYLFDNLKYFLIAEDSFSSVNKLADDLSSDQNLRWQIKDYQSSRQTFGKREVNRFEGRKSKILRDLIGYKALKSKLQKKIDEKYVTIPLGYVTVKNSAKNREIETTFLENELPIQYIPILENIKNLLDMVKTGPLNKLNFKSNKISMHLKTDKHRFKIELESRNDNNDYIIVVYYLIKNSNDLPRILDQKNVSLPNFVYSNLEVLLQDPNMFSEIIKTINGKRIVNFSMDDLISLKSKSPLSNYTEYTLSKYVVPVLLKRIIRQVKEWEKNDDITLIYNEKNLIEQKVKPDFHQSFVTNEWNSELQSIININKKHEQIEHDVMDRLTELQEVVNQFNPDLFTFITDTLRREKPIKASDSNYLFNYLKSIFEDLTVAVIDFGLTPSQWVNADNLQLWNTYQSQIQYLKHSLIVKLREIIDQTFDGEKLDLLINHEYTKNQVYTAIHGKISGDEYLSLKKTFVIFVPKLTKYKTELEDLQSIEDVIRKIEILDSQRRQNIKNQLPQLPAIKIT